ncbi:uncharacterized protein [Onthophagus taurus]|uniref:uncharacterized protein n=1 Tax=Onthophagus taurus TaxID=166361 RepID=UPI0039BE4EBB
MDRKTSNRCCMVKGCRSKAGKTLSFFRVPKNQERATQWLEACDRLDLQSKSVEHLYKNFSVCSLHFTENMYSGPYTKRLLPTAVPTKFHFTQTGGKPINKSSILYDILVKPTNSKENNVTTLFEKETLPEAGESRDQYIEVHDTQEQLSEAVFSPLLVEIRSECIDRPIFGEVDTQATQVLPVPSTSRSTSETQTQINNSLSSRTPRKKILRILRQENLKVQTLFPEAAEKSYTIEDFYNCCDKFLPKDLAKFVKVQARLYNNS